MRAVAFLAETLLGFALGFSFPATAQPLRLVEYSPWLTTNVGPEKSKGVIYYIRGWGNPRGTRGSILGRLDFIGCGPRSSRAAACA